MIHQKFLLAAFVFLIQTHLSAADAVRNDCDQSNGNYTATGAYAANLRTALFSISKNIDSNGFYNASTGDGSDRVNIIALCRGDIHVDLCRESVRKAVTDLMKSCPNQKKAIRWDGYCMVRYSNATIAGVLSTYPGMSWWPLKNATSPEKFKKDLQMLMVDLRKKAAAGSSLRKLAAGNATGPDFQTIFAFVQCTPDLSHEDCASCLIGAISGISKDGTVGFMTVNPSCNFRYEVYPFINETRLQEMEQPPAPVPPPPKAKSPPQSTPVIFAGKKNGKSNIRTIIIIVSATGACLVLAALLIIFLRKKKKKKPNKNLETVEEISSAESVQYSFSTIKAATNDFSLDNKLGRGGFGTVYKGKLQDGKEIAIKRLSMDSGQGDLEFKNEVSLLAKLQHRNLVRLLGFALEGMEKLLVYEFVENASLDHFIFDPNNQSKLDWDRRYKIITGVARGILYLHEDSRLKIIHRDLKASNILLDKDMNPKIADFGMAKLFKQDETHANTSRVVGTYGYMPPEYLIHGQFSIKSDVFSFGVLVLELITGRRNNISPTTVCVESLLTFAWRSWEEGRAADVVDPFLRSGSGSINEMVRCIHIGLLCVQEDAGDRPTMAAVLLMLNSFSITLALPSRPAFYSGTGFGSDFSRSQEYSSTSSGLKRSPVQHDRTLQKDSSGSELYPR